MSVIRVRKDRISGPGKENPMPKYVVVHTPIKHGIKDKAEMYAPGEEIELTTKEAQRVGDNVRPKIRETRAEPEPESPETEERPQAESPVPLEDMTVPQLTAALEEKGVEVPPKTRKADLIEMLKT